MDQEAMEPDMEQWTGSKLGKECVKAVYYYTAYLTSMQSTSCKMLDEAQAGIQIPRKNINSLRYADNTTLMAESKEELKSLLMKMKEESEKVGLKLNIKKKKKANGIIQMASSPITSWQIDGGKEETVAEFIFLGSKITEDGDCSHEIKRRLLLGRKAMINLDSVIKCRDITANKVPYNQSYGFSSGHVQMWESDH